MLRMVVDTNIWIRALLGGQTSLLVLIAMQKGQINPIYSEALLAELREVSSRSRLWENPK